MWLRLILRLILNTSVGFRSWVVCQNHVSLLLQCFISLVSLFVSIISDKNDKSERNSYQFNYLLLSRLHIHICYHVLNSEGRKHGRLKTVQKRNVLILLDYNG